MKLPDNETAVAEKTNPPATLASRREVMATAGLVGAVLLAANEPAQALAGVPLRMPLPPPAQVPRADLLNVFEYETQARLVAGAAKMAPVTGSDLTVTDRITLRPRMNIPTRDLDLTASLFGDQHFTPIIVGPMADQKRFHPEGEIATARGASAAKAAMVVSSDTSMPLAAIAQGLTTPLWLQVYANSPKLKDVLAEAHATNAKAVIVTVNAGPSANAPATPDSAHIDWAAVDAVVKGTSLPVIVKGITHPQDAKEAVARGAKGVVVSNYRGGNAAALKGTLLLIAPVVQAVGGQVPVLADGSFRYGADILKALALGAKGVLIGRPVMWGLAAYGADGVQGVVELLQTDLARIMAMCGRVNLAAVNDSLVRIHASLPSVKNNG
ncbi:MAG: alpha-hydroxy-acid oxidizing protein [Alphaproteobacteria bacterium]|nr:alpha-hydroxy-acid oxidizing protein [Alphaproteobacteria bacterium]